MRGLGLEEETCSISLRAEPIILPVVKSCKTQPCGVKMTQQFSELVILLTDMRFKLKEGTQRTSLRVILSLNLIVPVDEMSELSL